MPLIKLRFTKFLKDFVVSWIICLPLIKRPMQVTLNEFSSFSGITEPVPEELSLVYIFTPSVEELRLAIEFLIVMLHSSNSL